MAMLSKPNLIPETTGDTLSRVSTGFTLVGHFVLVKKDSSLKKNWDGERPLEGNEGLLLIRTRKLSAFRLRLKRLIDRERPLLSTTRRDRNAFPKLKRAKDTLKGSFNPTLLSGIVSRLINNRLTIWIRSLHKNTPFKKLMKTLVVVFRIGRGPFAVGFAIVKWLISVAYKTTLVLSAGAAGFFLVIGYPLKIFVNWVTRNRFPSGLDKVLCMPESDNLLAQAFRL
ncbi:hypothetical protein B0H16DRAFT_1464501 [Mycena metata]|uniref:Uncharacterized protein n=1 Tax=Mycena metata TaxID=1033252 RepID=A0AAD7N161_9AGAR|nr:hypothetical protein B0H16DRAFT_1464501 [Mycena metata]